MARGEAGDPEPDLIVAGIDTLDTQGSSSLEEEFAQAERDLRSIQMEEDRAIRVFGSVSFWKSGKLKILSICDGFRILYKSCKLQKPLDSKRFNVYTPPRTGGYYAEGTTRTEATGGHQR